MRNKANSANDLKDLAVVDDYLNYIFVNNLLKFDSIKMNEEYSGRPSQSQNENFNLNSDNLNVLIEVIKTNKENLNALSKEILKLNFIKSFLSNQSRSFKSLFKLHLSAYLNIFLIGSNFQLNVDFRLTQLTNQPQLKLISLSAFKPNDLIQNCSGTLITISKADFEDLNDARNDWSILNSYSKGLKLFLGPIRFVNHDCSNFNVELVIINDVLQLKVIKNINFGDEILLTYGNHYFNDHNIDCLCLSCQLTFNGKFRKSSENRSNDNTLKTRTKSYSKNNNDEDDDSSILTPVSEIESNHEADIDDDDVIDKDSNKCKNSLCLNFKNAIPLTFDIKRSLINYCYHCQLHYAIYDTHWPNRINKELQTRINQQRQNELKEVQHIQEKESKKREQLKLERDLKQKQKSKQSIKEEKLQKIKNENLQQKLANIRKKQQKQEIEQHKLQKQQRNERHQRIKRQRRRSLQLPSTSNIVTRSASSSNKKRKVKD